MHIIAAKAVSFGEALNPEFKTYAKAILDNAKTLADELMSRGFKLITNGTDNHLILIDVKTSFNIDGKIAEEALDAIGLTMNKNTIADDQLPPFAPSGLRLGTPAITSRGLTPKDMPRLAEWMYQAVKNREKPKILNKLSSQVREFVSGFPLPSDSK